jgi:hypothetical protein
VVVRKRKGKVTLPNQTAPLNMVRRKRQTQGNLVGDTTDEERLLKQ